MGCARCDGVLTPSTPTIHEDPVSIKARDHEAWDPDWITGSFVMTPACHACGKITVLAGEHKVDYKTSLDGTWHGDYEDFFRLRAASPGIRLIDVPDRTPDDVQTAVREAASVMWASPSSAVNGLRRAVERMLDHKRVRKTKVTTKRKRMRLTTHERIEIFRATEPDAALALEAVKWIGNEGSHSGEVAITDVLDGAGVLAYALDLLFGERTKAIQKQIATINKRKGVRKPKAAGATR